MFFRACALVVDSCGGNCQRIGVAIARAAGLSYAEIGARLHISKQAAHKHISAIAARNATLGEYLSGNSAAPAAIQAFPADVTEIERRANEELRRATAWLKRRN